MNDFTQQFLMVVDNDRPTYELLREMAAEAREEAEGGDRTAEGLLAERIKEMVEDKNPLEGKNDLYDSLLSSALAEVDYYEVAQQYLEE